MAASYTDHGGFNRDTCHAFGFFDGAPDGTDGGIEIDDEPFAQALGFRCAQREKLNLFLVDFRN